MTPNTQRQNRGGERGVAVVESAVILLTFFTVVFGIMEAGRFLNTQQVLTNAAREGARFAVAPLSGTNILPTPDEVEARVMFFLDSANLSGGATVTVARGAAEQVTDAGLTTTYTRVTVERPYQVLTMPIFSGLQITMTGESLMRNETSS